MSMTEMAQTLHCSRHTVYNALAQDGVGVQPVPSRTAGPCRAAILASQSPLPGEGAIRRVRA